MIDNNKKCITNYPYHIGIITAISGAVINDMKHVLSTQNFIGKLYIYNSLMQGENSVKSITSGIDYFN